MEFEPSTWFTAVSCLKIMLITCANHKVGSLPTSSCIFVWLLWLHTGSHGNQCPKPDPVPVLDLPEYNDVMVDQMGNYSM